MKKKIAFAYKSVVQAITIPSHKWNSSTASMFLMIFLAAIVSSCDKASDLNQPHLQSSNLLAAPLSASKGVPFKGRFETLEEVISETPELIQSRITGTGTGTLIGRSSFVADIEFDPRDIDAPITGVQTTTAANGDQIFSIFTGYAEILNEDGDIAATLVETITGGTGRFANSSGNFTVNALGNVNRPEGQNTFNGIIRF